MTKIGQQLILKAEYGAGQGINESCHKRYKLFYKNVFKKYFNNEQNPPQHDKRLTVVLLKKEIS